MSFSNLYEKYAYQKIATKAGIALKGPHFKSFFSSQFNPTWVEVNVENFLGGGKTKQILQHVRDVSEVALHGVNLNLAGTDPIDKAYFQKVKDLIKFINPVFYSEHLAWSSHKGKFFQDLLPFPLNSTTLQIISEKIDYVQNELQQEILIENPATYLSYKSSTYFEADFIAEIVKKTGCKLLLDVTNLYVSSKNHKFSVIKYLEYLQKETIAQYHVAGYETKKYREHQSLLIDSHNSAPNKEIWNLYTTCLEFFGPRPSLLEWDINLPDYEELLDESNRIQEILDSYSATTHNNAEVSYGQSR